MSIERLINHYPTYISTPNINNICSSNSNINSGSSGTLNSASLISASAITSSVSSPSSFNAPTTTLNLLSSNQTKKSLNTGGIDIKNDIHLRFLNPNDIYELKTLCSDWFPVE